MMRPLRKTALCFNSMDLSQESSTRQKDEVSRGDKQQLCKDFPRRSFEIIMLVSFKEAACCKGRRALHALTKFFDIAVRGSKMKDTYSILEGVVKE